MLRNLLARKRRTGHWRYSPSRETEAFGREVTNSIVKGLNDPRPLEPGELAGLLAHAEGIAKRSFSTLYEDEDE